MAAILDFKALKEGKLAIVEPIWSLEILVGAMLAFFIMHEQITFLQIIFIIALIAGLVLISVRSLKDFKHPHFEKAVLIAIISAIVMGSANFFIGWGARETNALVMNWFLNVFIAVPSLVVIILKGNLKNFWPSIKRNKGKLIGMCIFDNAAWIAFAQAMILAPIAIAVSLSESYIIVAVLLGIYVNREKLRIHQKIGLVLAIIAAVILATTI